MFKFLQNKIKKYFFGIYKYLVFMLPKRKILFLPLVLLLFLGIFLIIPHAEAATSVVGDITKFIIQGIARFVIWVFLSLSEFFIKMTLFFMQYFIALAKFNDYIDNPTVLLGWTMVRDVANMFFVVVLLVIAFGTILGAEQYQWNKTLVKLVLAAVFINFSNLICGLFIDIAHVFTISFVNAVSATAGGNLVQAFKLEEATKMVFGSEIEANTEINFRILVGAFAGFLFTFLVMVMIAIYAIIMLMRMVVLWVLIIFSPLAFIFQTMPQTKEYASKWWSMFAKHVMVAPIIVFFLWLTFATAGSGTIASDLGITGDLRKTEQLSTVDTDGLVDQSKKLATSMNKATEWTSMANFFIPLALMIVGINVVQGLGVVGGGLVQRGQDFMSKVATIASGYAAGRAVVRGGVGLGVKGVKAGLWRAPVIGGRNWRRLGWRISERVKETKGLRHLPFIGVGGEYHEKLDKRVKDRAEFNKKARLAELSYHDEWWTKGKVGSKLAYFGGLRRSSTLKRKSEARMQAAMGQKEEKTSMKKARTEAVVRGLGEIHLEMVEKKLASDWAEKEGKEFNNDEERVQAYREAAGEDSGLRREFKEALSKPFEEDLMIPDLDTGKMKKADIAEKAIARSAALMAFMEKEKERYTASKERKKGEQLVAYLDTAFGRNRFLDQVEDELNTYGPTEIENLKSSESRTMMEEKRDYLRRVVAGRELDEDGNPVRLEDAVKDPLIRAILAAEKKQWTDRARMKVEKELGSNVSASYLDPYIGGKDVASDAGAQFTEQLKSVFSQLTEAERGDAVASNHLLLAALEVMGSRASEEQKAAAAAILMSAIENGNVDDGAVMKAFNVSLLDRYDSLVESGITDDAQVRSTLEDEGYSGSVIDKIMNEEQRNAFRKEKENSTNFRWIQKIAKVDKQGNPIKDVNGNQEYAWADRTNDEAMLTYLNYSFTSGNGEHTRHSSMIGKIMEENDGWTWKQAGSRFYQGGYRNKKGELLERQENDEMNNYSDWEFENNKHQELFAGFQEKIKVLARASGHTQYHSTHGYDEKIKAYRPLALNESLNDKNGSIVKASNTHHNPQGVTDFLNMFQEARRIFGKKLRVLKVAKADTMNALNNIADERFQNTILLGMNRNSRLNKDEEGYANLLEDKSLEEGGVADTLVRRGYGDKKLGRFLQIMAVNAESLDVSSKQVGMVAADRTKQNATDARNGRVKIKFDGTDIKANNMKDLLDKTADYLTGSDADDVIVELKKRIAVEKDESVKFQMQEDLEMVKKNKGGGGVANRLKRKSKETPTEADVSESPQISQRNVEAVDNNISAIQQVRENSSNVDNAIDGFQQVGVQNIEDSNKRRDIAESSEQIRNAAKEGKESDIEKIAETMSNNIANVLDNALRSTLQDAFENMVNTLKNNVIKIDPNSLVNNFEDVGERVGDSDLQGKILAAVKRLKGALDKNKQKDDLFSSLNVSNAQVENKDTRGELQSLLTDLKKAKTKEDIQKVSVQINEVVNNQVQVENSTLATKLKENVNQVQVIHDINIQDAIDALNKLGSDYKKMLQDAEKRRREDQEVLLDDENL